VTGRYGGFRRLSRVRVRVGALNLNAQEALGVDTWPVLPERLNWGRMQPFGGLPEADMSYQVLLIRTDRPSHGCRWT